MRGLAVLMFAAFGFAQTPPEFEVASIKPDHSGGGNSSMRATKVEVTLENASLRKCIGLAYGIGEDRDYALSSPDWMNFEKFDIVAKFPPDSSRAQIQLMLQTLLADRFKLKLHHETKEVAVNALVVGSALKMTVSAPGTAAQVSMSPGHITGRATTLQSLADHLSNANVQLGRPVVNQTGLAGRYDFTLEGAPENLPVGEATAPSIFTAVQEQLGLKLDRRKAPVEVIVIDSAEKIPTGD